MDLHDRPVQADRFDLDADNLLFLHLFEQLIQHAGFGPTVHAGMYSHPGQSWIARRHSCARLRRENLASLLAEVRAWLATFDTFEQLQVQVSEAGLAVGRIQTVSEFAKSDWVREWNAVVEVDDRGGGSVRMPGNPWIFSRSELPCPGAPAYQGEHNGEILKELQVSEDKIRDLEERSITLSRR